MLQRVSLILSIVLKSIVEDYTSGFRLLGVMCNAETGTSCTCTKKQQYVPYSPVLPNLFDLTAHWHPDTMFTINIFITFRATPVGK